MSIKKESEEKNKRTASYPEKIAFIANREEKENPTAPVSGSALPPAPASPPPAEGKKPEEKKWQKQQPVNIENHPDTVPSQLRDYINSGASAAPVVQETTAVATAPSLPPAGPKENQPAETVPALKRIEPLKDTEGRLKVRAGDPGFQGASPKVQIQQAYLSDNTEELQKLAGWTPDQLNYFLEARGKGIPLTDIIRDLTPEKTLTPEQEKKKRRQESWQEALSVLGDLNRMVQEYDTDKKKDRNPEPDIPLPAEEQKRLMHLRKQHTERLGKYREQMTGTGTTDTPGQADNRLRAFEILSRNLAAKRRKEEEEKLLTYRSPQTVSPGIFPQEPEIPSSRPDNAPRSTPPAPENPTNTPEISGIAADPGNNKDDLSLQDKAEDPQPPSFGQLQGKILELYSRKKGYIPDIESFITNHNLDPNGTEAAAVRTMNKENKLHDETLDKQIRQLNDRLKAEYLTDYPTPDVTLLPDRIPGFRNDYAIPAFEPEEESPNGKEPSLSPEKMRELIAVQVEELSQALKDTPGYWEGEEGRNYATARNFLEDAQRVITGSKEAKENSTVDNFLRSFGREITNPDTYSFGINAVDNIARLLVINEKLEKLGGNPEELPYSEQVLLAAAALSQAAEDSYSQDLTLAQQAGSSVAQLLPTLIQTVATGGVAGGAATAARVGVTKVLKKMVRKGILKRTLSSLASKGVRQMAEKTTDRILQSIVMSILQPSTYKNIGERRMGHIQYAPTTDGTIAFSGLTDQASFGDAFFNGVGDQSIENIFNTSGGNLFNGLKTSLSRIKGKIPAMGNLMSKAESNEIYNSMKRILEKTKPGVMVEDFLEEISKNCLQAWLTGNENALQSLSIEGIGVIAIQSCLLEGCFTGWKAGKNAVQNRRIVSDLKKAEADLATTGLSGEKLRHLRQSVSSSTPEQQIEFIRNFSAENALDANQTQTVMNFILRANRYYGMKNGIKDRIEEETEKTVRKIRETVNPDMDAIVTARVSGYNEPVYIVGKQIGLTPEGKINYRNSSSRVYIQTPHGRELIPIEKVEEIKSRISGKEAIENEGRRTREELTRQADAEIHGDIPTAPMEPGQVILLPQGKAIVRSFDNNRYRIEMPDSHEIIEMTPTELERLIFDHNKAIILNATEPAQHTSAAPDTETEIRTPDQENPIQPAKNTHPQQEPINVQTETQTSGHPLQNQEIQNRTLELSGKNDGNRVGIFQPQEDKTDYLYLTDPARFREELKTEFGPEAPEVLSNMIAEAQKEIEKAGQEPSPIGRMTARLKAATLLEKLMQIKGMSGESPDPHQTTVSIVPEQPGPALSSTVPVNTGIEKQFLQETLSVPPASPPKEPSLPDKKNGPAPAEKFPEKKTTPQKKKNNRPKTT